jgi:RNA polymerase sigma-70 factor (ECF subfamily)
VYQAKGPDALIREYAPESNAVARERPMKTADPLADLVARGVASMPTIYKVVINLRDFEGFSTEETSRILGLKESTVKVRLHRARLLLKEWLEKHGAL